MSSQIDETKPVVGTPTTDSVRANFSIAKAEISTLQDATVGGPFLPLGGGRLTGPMYLYNDPTDGRMPATKDYVDASGGGGGGGGIPEAPADGVNYGRSSGAWVPALPIAGGTLTGPLVAAADPTDALGVATKQMVDAITPVVSGAVQKAGDTMTGPLTLSGPPTAVLHGATKAYVDAADALKAPLASPLFTGNPTGPTPPVGNTTAQLATCGFVANGFLPLSGGNLTGTLGAQQVSSVGALAGYNMAARDGAAPTTWSLYATGGILRIWGAGVGDMVTIDAGGSMRSNGNLYTTSGNLCLGSQAAGSPVLGRTSSNILTIIDYAGGNLNQMNVNVSNTYWFGTQWAQQIIPKTDNAYVCGVNGNAWSNIYSYYYGTSSDAALKTDIENLPECLGIVERLDPKRFKWTNAAEDDPHRDDVHWGFVAQDVRAAIGDLPFGGHREDEGGQSLAYNELVALLWKACQEMAAELRDLRAAIGGSEHAPN